jgi:predicted nuclease of restriction endonuclease-like RecB superfamily
VVEALRRQERRVRDATRLAGIAKALLDACDFAPPPGADRAADIRDAVFRARGSRWPPVPGDERVPYETAAAELDRSVSDVERLLYADRPAARVLVRAARQDGRALLARYNLELARAVLLDAERVTIRARGGWRAIFRALKLARLMHVVRRVGRSYEIELTGPAAAFLVRPGRYGARFARVIPALAHARDWRIRADLRRGEGVAVFRARGRPRAKPGAAPLGAVARRATHDSSWEQSLAKDFRRRLGSVSSDWHLSRETTPVVVGEEVFLPDFTLRHTDGREALIELVGFWTPEYLEAKARKVAAAHLDHLILVVYRGLAVGGRLDALTSAVTLDRVVWFTKRPRAADVLRVAERCARR